MSDSPGGDLPLEKAAETDRRKFLGTAGKFAVVVPPAMTFLLSTTLASEAIAQSQQPVREGFRNPEM